MRRGHPACAWVLPPAPGHWLRLGDNSCSLQFSQVAPMKPGPKQSPPHRALGGEMRSHRPPVGPEPGQPAPVCTVRGPCPPAGPSLHSAPRLLPSARLAPGCFGSDLLDLILVSSPGHSFGRLSSGHKCHHLRPVRNTLCCAHAHTRTPHTCTHTHSPGLGTWTRFILSGPPCPEA